MRDRLSPPATRPITRRVALSVDVVLLTPHGRQLTLLLVRSLDSRAKERWETPWDTVRAGETLEDAAQRIARAALGAAPAMVEQVGAFGGKRHPGDADVSVAFLALAPAGSPAPMGGDNGWFPVDDLPAVPPRHRAVIDSTLQALRGRVDQSPIAFRLLPATFTLSQLQEVYEMLLGRRLHKASFRRALHAAWLVEPTDEWRTEGRGRPAQLFRYAPRRRRGTRRGVRFEAMGG
ncbi:MAG: NUDIX hydrolase [Gemmatimonadaceae bacterium]